MAKYEPLVICLAIGLDPSTYRNPTMVHLINTRCINLTQSSIAMEPNNIGTTNHPA